MSDDNDDAKVGYGRPPRHKRWKKGQTGNPKKKYVRKPKSDAALIDKLWMSRIKVKSEGEPRKVFGLEAILMQLWKLAISGNRRAQRIYDLYQEYFRLARSPVFETIFEDGDNAEILNEHSEG